MSHIDPLHLRRSLWPLREVIYRLSREDAAVIADDTRMLLRNLYDHVSHVIEIVETFQEIAAGTMEVYLSSIGNRMNNTMEVLTIISTIFIPLTFVAGSYGMDFACMPEVDLVPHLSRACERNTMNGNRKFGVTPERWPFFSAWFVPGIGAIGVLMSVPGLSTGVPGSITRCVKHVSLHCFAMWWHRYSSPWQ